MPLNTSTVPQQVAEHLRTRIFSGHWSGKMPGRDLLATELKVSPRSVQEALRILEEEKLLIPQGPGKRCHIELPKNQPAPPLRIAILGYEPLSETFPCMPEILNELIAAGHDAFYTNKTLSELGMQVARIARYVSRTEADAWVVAGAARPVLDWFAEREMKTFALFGVRHGLPMAGAGPDHGPAIQLIVRKLAMSGHRQIVYLRRSIDKSEPLSNTAKVLLDELGKHGLPNTARLVIPRWKHTPDGLHQCLNSLLRRAEPTTALIADVPDQLIAAMQYLGQRGIQIPQDISLVCLGPPADISLCKPSISFVRWDDGGYPRRVVRWANIVARGKKDHRQMWNLAKFVEGETIGPAPKHTMRSAGKVP